MKVDKVLKIKDWLKQSDPVFLSEKCLRITKNLTKKYNLDQSDTFIASDCAIYLMEKSYKYNRFDDLFLNVVAKRYLFSNA